MESHREEPMHYLISYLPLISCAANLVLQGKVKSVDGTAGLS